MVLDEIEREGSQGKEKERIKWIIFIFTIELQYSSTIVNFFTSRRSGNGPF